MEIEIENTKDDYRDFFKYFYFKRTILYRIFLAITIAVIFSGNEYHETKTGFIQLSGLVPIFLIGGIAFILTTLLPYFIALRRLSFQISTIELLEGKKKFTITDGGVRVESKFENVFWNWEMIKVAGETEKSGYFIVYTHRIYILPIKYFNSIKDPRIKDTGNFIGAVQHNLIKTKRGNSQKKAKWGGFFDRFFLIDVIPLNAMEEKKLNPRSGVWQLYWWGLLGFIPFVGAIAGLVLLLRGIVGLKDKFLILIGASCILMTILFWTYLSYQQKKDNVEEVIAEKEMEKREVDITQMRLNNLMKDIEFYKMQNGVYPDSLEQIKKNDEMAWIDDPIQMMGNGTKNTKFNYKKIGRKYYLFSSGIDGIPNTADDIYPSIISSQDSSKFGLIKSP